MSATVHIALLMPLAFIGAFAGLVVYWSVSGWIEYRRRGFRIRSLPAWPRLSWKVGTRQSWIYEERVSDGRVRALPFVRVITVEPSYPAWSEIEVPTEREWPEQVPNWASERRSEIIARIKEAGGSRTTVRAEP